MSIGPLGDTDGGPPIVCMCGSTRFKQAWISENARLTGEGNIVLSVALWGHHERKDPDPETKARLNELHLRMIDLSDWIYVLDVGSYIGEDTKREIEYAKEIGRPVRYLSQEFPDYKEPIDEVLVERDAMREYLTLINGGIGGAELKRAENALRAILDRKPEGG